MLRGSLRFYRVLRVLLCLVFLIGLTGCHRRSTVKGIEAWWPVLEELTPKGRSAFEKRLGPPTACKTGRLASLAASELGIETRAIELAQQRFGSDRPIDACVWRNVENGSTTISVVFLAGGNETVVYGGTSSLQ